MTAPAFDNSYARLPDRFYTRLPGTPVAAPKLFALNETLAHDLGLDVAWLRGDDGQKMLAGNGAPDTAAPLAQVYAGHQFGGWSPQLGDGRALLLGEIVDRTNTRRDIQLKGSGPTPYSRMGDGRAGLGPVIREYLVSEAMHALGIPTTRALAAMTTGEVVRRDRPSPGAVLTRVAASHIRVGTFQYFAAQQDTEALELLTQHAIARHHPGADGALGLLRAVMQAQAALIAQWLGVGFIHGVMNTDNMTISGETIDYGPCAFMDAYAQDKVFSSIDQFGRYAYDKQPDIALWNLAQLASALLPLIDPDQDKAVELATEMLNDFDPLFRTHWRAVFGAKIGLATPTEEDDVLIHQLLARMQSDKSDFTNVFSALPDGTARDHFTDPALFDDWAETWAERRAADGPEPEAQEALMR